MTQLDTLPGVAPAARLTLTLLGPAQIARDGQPLSFAYEKVQALLVYLAVETGRAHRRTVLADLLWPEQDETAARHSLSQALFNLRRAVQDDQGSSLLLTTRDTVRLNPASAIWVDVTAFRVLISGADSSTMQLEQAIARYRGEFLESFSIGDSAAFEEWALLIREHLRGQACDVLRRLTAPHSAVGDSARVCDYARRWVALDPLSEEAHRRLMQVLAESGQRTAALAQFEHCRRLLHDELGIEPEPATLALYEELRRSVAPARPTPVREALPLPATRLIDRGRELAELGALLADPANRLITITGPGGVGKTRLALHAAAAQALTFRDGVCFVPLAPVRDPALVLTAIAQALGVQRNGAQPLDELVRAALAQRQLLLLLDNCEHLLPAAASLAADLLAAAPAVVMLATSRVTLRLSQERRYPLAPLTVPAADQAAASGRPQSGAVALFVERAQAVRPAVELDYRAIGAICRRLDGLPLAIELAATRAQLLNPRELLDRLEQRLPLLSTGLRDVPERQQTLHATIDWSYQLLEPQQQALLRRLAVFAGGWTVAAAEAVCADLSPAAPGPAASVLDRLAALLDASLIREMSGAGEPRCTMLETIREYAHAQLVAHGELARAQELHAHYLVTLAAQAAAELSGTNQLVWLQRIDAELDNVRTALSWCSTHASGAGLRLASDLSRFWDIRGYRSEGRDWLETLLDAHPDQPAPTIEERAAGLLVAGMLAMFLSDFAPASSRLHESLGLYQQLEDAQNIGRVLNNLGNVALQQGAYPEAEQYYRESLALRRELNHTMGIASSLHNLALTTRLQGDLRAAKTYYDQSLTLYRQIGDLAAVASVMGHIATILLQQGEYLQAQQQYQASHAIAQQLGHKPGLRQTLSGLGDVARMQRRYHEAKGYYQQSLTLSAEIHHVGAMARNLFCFAVIAWAEEELQRAAVLLSAAAGLYHRAQTAPAPEDIAEFDQHLAAVRAALGAATFDAAWDRGQALALEQAIAMALEM